jgi:Leucine-rich repeat (LRR) protein
LGNLSNLSNLWLDSNKLTGSIPSELGNLSNLTTLELSHNQLTSSIPSELGNLSNLKWLWLNNNELCGEIPVKLKNLSNMYSLQLDNNHLTASDSELIAWLNSHNPGWETTQTPCPQHCTTVTEIPSTECEALIAFYNSTDGDNWEYKSGWTETNTPCSWYGVTCSGGHVSKLHLPSNQLSGTIPPEIAQLSNLEYLNLIYNELSGTIPPEIAQLSKLRHLWLFSNQLSGTIPPEIAQLSNLEFINLYYNQLSGTIPPEIAQLSKLRHLWLFSNQLSGTIPPEIAQLSNLESLHLDYNELSGTIPPEIAQLSNLERLYLSSNQLSGTIPPEIAQLNNLERLHLNSNQLCGEIPVELKNLSKIPLPDQDGIHLMLDNNHLTASDSELIAWLDSHNPGWETTQTPCPQQECKLQFSSATYSVAEDGEQITITVTRTNSSDGAVSVEYATSDDTATNPDDYTQSTGTLYWSDGDDADKTFTVSITEDTIFEGDETFNLTLGNATGGAIISDPDTAVVTITDNDPTEKHGILQFTKAEFSVREDVHTAQAILIVERIGGSDGVVLVEFATSDDSAKAGSDYTYTKGGVRWEDGDDDDKTFTVHIINDDEPENNETFIVSLANPIGGAEIGSPDTATVTIKDDDKTFNCKKASGISTKECQALVALYDSTDGENWEDNSGWKTTKKPCNWNGVTCQKKHVTGLRLWNNNLKGSISKDLFKLKKLEDIALSNNDLNGTSLNNFKKLKNLETLLIDNCKLSGKIPSSLMKLKKLTYLDLNDNCLKTKVSSKLKKWLDEINPGWDETQGTDCLY